MQLRSWLGKISLAAGSLLVGLLVLEAAVWLVIRPTDVPQHRADPLVGFGLEPGQEGVWKSGPIVGRFAINAQGYNNGHDYAMARLPGRLRVAILGDSFVEAFQVRPDERFFDLLERDLGRNGLNLEIDTFAVSGYGTGQQWLLLKRDIARLKPDMVVTVFVSNDLSDTACVLNPPAVKPCFERVGDNSLRLREATPHRPSRLGRLVLRSALMRYLLIQRRLLDRVRQRGTTAPAGSPIYLAEAPPEWAEAWRVVEACLREMAAFCHQRGIRFLLVHQPLVDDGIRAAVTHAGRPVDFGLPARRLAEASARSGFEFFDLSSDLERAAVSSPEPLLLPGEGHWSAAGHRAVAAALLPRLREALTTRADSR